MHIIVWTEHDDLNEIIINMVSHTVINKENNTVSKSVGDAEILTCNSLKEFKALVEEKSSLFLLLDIAAFSRVGSALQEVLLSPEMQDRVYALVLVNKENIGKLSTLQQDCYDDFMLEPYSELELSFRLQRGLDRLSLETTWKAPSYSYNYNNKNHHQNYYHQGMALPLNAELENARRLHERTLPRYFPSIEGLSQAAYYRPAAHLGGDYYNFFQVDHGVLNVVFEHYLFYLSDVTGHGLDSTVLSIFMKDTINSYFSFKHAEGELLSPASIMEYLVGEYLDEDFPEDYFVCLFLGVLDMKLRQIIFSTAGFQVAPLILKESGEMWEPEIGGMPVSAALMPDMMQYEDLTLDLEPGMTVLFSTDGLFEQKSPEGAAYEARLKEIFADKGSLPPELLVQIIENDLCQFVGKNEFDDDLTFMVMQFHSHDHVREQFFVDTDKSGEQREVIREKLQNHLQKQAGITQGYNDKWKLTVESFVDIFEKVFMMETASLEMDLEINHRYLHIKIKCEEVEKGWKEKVGEMLGLRGNFVKSAKYDFDYIFLTRKENEVNLVKVLTA